MGRFFCFRQWKVVDWVSNLLGSPASGELVPNPGGDLIDAVSNLLGSPASGEFVFPHEICLRVFNRFQFIGFPSEWGAAKRERNNVLFLLVSNLLGSPASGEPQKGLPDGPDARVSNLLGSPASGELFLSTLLKKEGKGFQFIGFPSEWGEKIRL